MTHQHCASDKPYAARTSIFPTSNAPHGFRLYAGSPLVASNHEVCQVLRGIPPTDNFSGSPMRCPASAKARHSAPPVSAEICQTCRICFVHYQHLHISQKLRIGRRITCKNAKQERKSAHDGRSQSLALSEQQQEANPQNHSLFHSQKKHTRKDTRPKI